MMQILAMHGWAGHAGAWSHWRKHFEQGGSTWNVAERGYGSEKPIPPAWTTAPKRNGPARTGLERNVLIAHSLGLHLLPASVLEKASAVVLLGSFTRFVPDGRAGRSIGAALQGMQAALGTDQELPMLERFLDKAASPHALSALPPNPLLQGLTSLGRQRLQQDLDLLANCRTLPTGWPDTVPVLVVQGERDAVVPAESAQQLIDALGHQPLTLHRGPTWGHALITPRVFVVVQRWLEGL